MPIQIGQKPGLKPLSPIKKVPPKKTTEGRSTSPTKQSGRNKKTLSKDFMTDPYDGFDQPQPKGKKKFPAIPKNINQYRHIIDQNCLLGIGDLRWTLGLRGYAEETKKSKGKDEEETQKLKVTTDFKAPSFYDDDLKKYTLRNKKRSKTPKIIVPNFREIVHLTKTTKNGTVNDTIFRYEANLRDIGKTTTGFNNPNKWKQNPYYLLEPDETQFLMPTLSSSKEAFRKVEKYTTKPFISKYTKTTVGDDTVKRRVLVPDPSKTIGNFRENLSLQPYSTQYTDVNIFPHHELLDAHTNQQCLFELNLRSHGPLKRNRPKRMTHDAWEKQREKMIKKNHELAKKGNFASYAKSHK